MDPARVVVGTPEDEQVEGSRVGLVAGRSYPVGFLFQALALQSGNDAANALARAAGGIDATVDAMTATAESLGAYDTVVGDPSGLDVAGQSSSPYDLALIFRDVVADPMPAAVLATPTAQVPEVPGRAAAYQVHRRRPARPRDRRRLVVSVLGTENQPLRAADQAAPAARLGLHRARGHRGRGRAGDAGRPAAGAPAGPYVSGEDR